MPEEKVQNSVAVPITREVLQEMLSVERQHLTELIRSSIEDISVAKSLSESQPQSQADTSYEISNPLCSDLASSNEKTESDAQVVSMKLLTKQPEAEPEEKSTWSKLQDLVYDRAKLLPILSVRQIGVGLGIGIFVVTAAYSLFCSGKGEILTPDQIRERCDPIELFGTKNEHIKVITGQKKESDFITRAIFITEYALINRDCKLVDEQEVYANYRYRSSEQIFETHTYKVTTDIKHKIDKVPWDGETRSWKVHVSTPEESFLRSSDQTKAVELLIGRYYVVYMYYD